MKARIAFVPRLNKPPWVLHTSVLMAVFCRVNRKLCDILGYTPAELMGLSFQEITAPAYLAADLENVHKMLAKEMTTYCMEKRYVRKDGGLTWANLTVSLAREPNW